MARLSAPPADWKVQTAPIFALTISIFHLKGPCTKSECASCCSKCVWLVPNVAKLVKRLHQVSLHHSLAESSDMDHWWGRDPVIVVHVVLQRFKHTYAIHHFSCHGFQVRDGQSMIEALVPAPVRSCPHTGGGSSRKCFRTPCKPDWTDLDHFSELQEFQHTEKKQNRPGP